MGCRRRRNAGKGECGRVDLRASAGRIDLERRLASPGYRGDVAAWAIEHRRGLKRTIPAHSRSVPDRGDIDCLLWNALQDPGSLRNRWDHTGGGSQGFTSVYPDESHGHRHGAAPFPAKLEHQAVRRRTLANPDARLT